MKDAVPFCVFVAVWVVIYCVVCPLDAYAGDLMWDRKTENVIMYASFAVIFIVLLPVFVLSLFDLVRKSRSK